MAGDWIKIEHALPTKPEVFQISDSLGCSENETVGLLVRFWTWVDQNMSRSCPAVYGTIVRIDSLVNRDGFASAMVACGWLKLDGDRVEIPNYDEHLSQSAKARALEAKRKKRQRENVPRPAGQMSRSKPDTSGTKPGTREEKRREEKKEDNTDCDSAPPTASGKKTPLPVAAVKTDQTHTEKAVVKARERCPLFDAIVFVTGADPKLNGSLIGKARKALLGADPPYTPEEVLRFGETAHIEMTWLDGRRPTIPEVEKYIGRVRNPSTGKVIKKGFETHEDKTNRMIGDTIGKIIEREEERDEPETPAVAWGY